MKVVLDSAELLAYKQDAFDKTVLLYNNILNILDNELSTEDKNYAKASFKDIFMNSEGGITDFFRCDVNVANSYKFNNYIDKLLSNELNLSLFEKEIKINKEAKVKKGPLGIINNDNSVYFRVYNLDIYAKIKNYLSYYFNDPITNNTIPNYCTKNFFQNLKFKILHDKNHHYTVRIVNIPSINKKYNNYKKIKSSLEEENSIKMKSEIDTSFYKKRMYCPDNITVKKRSLIPKPIKYYNNFLNKGGYFETNIPLDTSSFILRDKYVIDSFLIREYAIISQDDDIMHCSRKIKVDTTGEYIRCKKPIPPKTIDYLLPGYGHRLYQSPNQKIGQYFRIGFYSSGFLISTGLAIYYKTKSDISYNKHKNDITIRSLDYDYNMANVNHKKFVISTISATGFYIANMINLKLLYLIQKSKYKNKINKKDCTSNIKIINTYDGIKITYNF